MSNSYSALIRRSKLATLSPAIEQVYSSYGGHLSRSSFGLKRPLPSSPSEPYIRINELDTPQRRTRYRQATREAFFVKKWAQADLRIDTKDHTLQTTVQSRFVPTEVAATFGKGAVAVIGHEASLHEVRSKAPNVLSMTGKEFERLLEELGERRTEFVEFMEKELEKDSSAQSKEVLLYGNAQKKPGMLNDYVERFLAHHLPQKSTSSNIALVHPFLSLQYSSPTPLELSFAPPIPGRILSTSQSQNANKFSGSTGVARALVLGHVSDIKIGETGGKAPTSFFPDTLGIRSNEPGRANFTLSPQIQPTVVAEAFALASGRSTQPFRGATTSNSRYISGPPAHEPTALTAISTLTLNPTVVTQTSRPLPGSQEYVAVTEVPTRSFGLSDLMSSGSVKDYFIRGNVKERARWGQQKLELTDTRKTQDNKLFPRRKPGQTMKRGTETRPRVDANSGLNELFNLLGGQEGGETGDKK